jgi:putative intracellular protease/amidase
MPSSTPLNFFLPIFPGFQLLDLAGPLDILNLLSTNQLDATKQPLSLKFVAETLDPVPVKPIVPKGVNWKFDLKDGYPNTPGGPGNPNVSFNQYLTPDLTYDHVLKSLKSGDTKVDVILVPGGVGTRLKRTHQEGTTSSNIASLMDFLPKVAPHVSTAIITVCTGSDALAQTGLLDGRRATTNMSRWKDVTSRSPQVHWVDFARWVRSTRSEASSASTSNSRSNGAERGEGIEIWTSAGISAGMDVTLAFIAEYYGGIEVSRGLAKALEYDWREIGEGEEDPLYVKHFKNA